MSQPLPQLPGIRAATARAGLFAAVQTAGLVVFAVALGTALARIAGHGRGWLGAALLAATIGALVRAAAGVAGEVLAGRDARRMVADLRDALLRRFVSDGDAVVAAGGVGPAAVLVANRISAAASGMAAAVTARGQAGVAPILVLVALAVLDWPSALVVGICLPLVPLFMVLVGQHTRDQTTATVRALDRISTHIAELVRGLPVLVGLGQAARQLNELRRLGQRHRRRTLAALRSAFLSALVLELLAALAVALVAVSVGLRLLDGSLELAAGLAALLLAPEAFAALRALGAAYHAVDDASEAVTRARALLAQPASTSVATVDTDESLAIVDLTVWYAGRDGPAVSNLAAAIAPGELVRLAGPSGCGKSTVLDVLAGRLRPGDAARVEGRVEGVPPRVGFLPQHPRCAADTVADELSLHGAGPNDVAQLLTSLALPLSLGARRCAELSPGELQLVALARALVRVRRGARLLLLDEPSAHLDPARTQRVAGVLRQVRGQVTTLLVSHEPVLAALADRELVLR